MHPNTATDSNTHTTTNISTYNAAIKAADKAANIHTHQAANVQAQWYSIKSAVSSTLSPTQWTAHSTTFKTTV